MLQRERLSRGSSEEQTGQWQPIMGTPVEVPEPRMVMVRGEVCMVSLYPQGIGRQIRARGLGSWSVGRGSWAEKHHLRTTDHGPRIARLAIQAVFARLIARFLGLGIRNFLTFSELELLHVVDY